MPGIKKYSDVTLKKGVFKSDNKFWDWFNEIKMNTIKRAPVTISLLDEDGAPTMVWTLTNERSVLLKTLDDGTTRRTAFGREYDHLLANGYSYDSSTGVMVREAKR